jgi:uncharacterized membrane protein
MTRRTRTFLGTVLILLLLVVYAIGAAALLGEWFASLPGWAAVIAIAIVGVAWFLPATIIVRWMSAPDRP